ncbi:MAG: ABC transporter ATP-binding protein [Candidatus Ornithospirochaeta sp.]
MPLELLRMENVSKSYSVGNGKEKLEILSDISFTLLEGESMAIKGKSGCGKSTLLSVAALLSDKDSGKVFYRGKDSDEISRKELPEVRNRTMGFVFQSSMLLEDFSAIENVAMPLMIRGIGKKEALERAREYLSLVEMTDRMTHRPSRLSGGERQRTAIARALVGEPDVVFADEPTGSLDEKSARGVEELLLSSVRATGRGLVLVTHNPLFADKADKTYVLSEGRLLDEE